MDLADRRNDVVDVAVRKTRIERDHCEASMYSNGPRTALRAISNGSPPIAGKRRPLRMRRQFVLDGWLERYERNLQRRTGRNILGTHRGQEPVAPSLRREAEPNCRTGIAGRI